MRRALMLLLTMFVLAGCTAAPSDKPPLPSVSTTPTTTSTSTPAPPSPPTTTTQPTAAPPTNASGPKVVTIQGSAFHPATLGVHVGDNVTWQNADGFGHTSTSDTNVWDTGKIASDEASTFTFTVAGTYPYYCSFHSFMKGTITVT
ncbi:MAG: plastocyanin/azurin family copper-binding protein [Candidatus Thermoplasmatota archaeon]|jgi:plastocyanin